MNTSNQTVMPVAPEPLLEAPSDYYGPANFKWLIKGRLAGMPQPGIVSPIESDLSAIHRMKIDLIVSLTQEWEPPVEKFNELGMNSLYVPIEDMHPPTMDQAWEACAQIEKHVTAGRSIAYHCRAGCGRTGTLLAAQLIWYSPDSDAAIRAVKAQNRNWIETDGQLKFLEDFASKRCGELNTVFGKK